MLIITIASVLFALVMSVVAWRATQAERARSDARVEALARDIHGPSRSFEELAPSLVDEVPLRLAAVRAEHVPASEMFAVAAHGRSGSRWGLAVAVGAFAVACTAALLIVLSGETPGTPVAVASGAERPTASAAAVAEVPLELTALSHERNAGQLTVQGVVRNPAAGTEMDHLSAVVALFDADGHAVTTGRVPLASSALIPGGESPFAVTIPVSGDVARYRVSFRSDERVVSHIDRRTAP